MTTENIIAIAKEKFGKDLTQEEAQAYLDKKIPLPDEAMELVTGGSSCLFPEICPGCGGQMVKCANGWRCNYCGRTL